MLNADELLIDSHKLHLHPERVAQWLSAETVEDKMGVFPLYVEVSPVGHCNHRCTFCAVDYIGYKPRAISLSALRDCLRSMALNGVRSVMYAGEGEPLLHKNIVDIVHETKIVGIDVAFTTNGVLMTERFIQECLHEISWIKVSLNAGDAKTYAAVHQTKEQDFDTVLRNLQIAVTTRDLTGMKTTIGVQMVVLPENIYTIDVLIEELALIGVDYLVLKPYSQHHSSVNKYDIDYNQWDEFLKNIVKTYSTDAFKVIYRRDSAIQTDRGYTKCYSTPNFWAYIMATGDVYGCSAYLLDDRFKYGNINEQSFEAIWLGDKRKQSLEYVENHLDISECRKNCRLDKGNQYLWQLKHPKEHDAFI